MGGRLAVAVQAHVKPSRSHSSVKYVSSSPSQVAKLLSRTPREELKAWKQFAETGARASKRIELNVIMTSSRADLGVLDDECENKMTAN
jgi:hypothetical protein